MSCAIRAKDGLFGLFMLVLSVALIAQSHSYQNESSQFPRFLAYTLAGLSFAYLFNIWRQGRNRAPASGQAEAPCQTVPFWPLSPWVRQCGSVFVLLAAYLYGINLLGYYSASALFLVGSMLGYSRSEVAHHHVAPAAGGLPQGRFVAVLVAAGGFLVLTWLLFTRFLGTRMPEGLLL